MNYISPSLGRAMTIIIILTAVSLACAIPGLGNNQPAASGTGPVVTISSPTAGQKLEPGREIKVQSSSVDAVGVARVELVVDGQVVWVDANAQPEPGTPFIVAQPWLPETPGSHVLQIRAYNTANVAGQSEPLTVAVVAAAQAADDSLPTATVEPEVNVPTNTPIAVIEDAPTATMPPLPTPTRPSATPTPAAPTPTRTATPTPGTFTSTGLKPDGRFKDIWEELDAGESRLGYPTGPEITGRDFAKQYFEKGMMYWWDSPDDPDYIWVIDSPEADLNSGATSNRYVDDWDGDEAYACDAARSNSDKGPVRGFGKLWCERPELQARLGNPREREVGSGGNPPYGYVQFYQGGVMLYNPINGEVFVLFDQGDWQRFSW